MPRRSDIDGSVPAPARLLGQVARVLLSASLLLVAACSDAPVFTKLFTTEHFVYYAEEGAAPPVRRYRSVARALLQRERSVHGRNTRSW